MSNLRLETEDDSWDDYWDPSLSSLENNHDNGRDKILDTLLCIHHFFRHKMYEMTSRTPSVVSSVKYKVLYQLGMFIYQVIMLAMQAKFSFFTNKIRHLPRRQDLAKIINRHSLSYHRRSHAFRNNRLLTNNSWHD